MMTGSDRAGQGLLYVYCAFSEKSPIIFCTTIYFVLYCLFVCFSLPTTCRRISADASDGLKAGRILGLGYLFSFSLD